METNTNNATQMRYTLAPREYGDMTQFAPPRIGIVSPYSRPRTRLRSGTSTFYHFDAIGSTRFLTADDESVPISYVWDAFGGWRATVGSTTNRFRYLGKLGYYQEAAANGYYVRRRYYTPEVGRFLSTDPIRTAGLSLYAYVRNGPTVATDPSGLGVPVVGKAACRAACQAITKAKYYKQCEYLCKLLKGTKCINLWNLCGHMQRHPRCYKYKAAELCYSTFLELCQGAGDYDDIAYP
jgi:RHS repeat-associated protein